MHALLRYRLLFSRSTTDIFFKQNYDVTAFSDARIKTDLRRIEGALGKVAQLSGYTYLRTDEDAVADKRQCGVIAQEVAGSAARGSARERGERHDERRVR